MKIATLTLTTPWQPTIGDDILKIINNHHLTHCPLTANQNEISVIGRLSDVRRCVRELATKLLGDDWTDEPLETICERFGEEIGYPVIELIYDTRSEL